MAVRLIQIEWDAQDLAVIEIARGNADGTIERVAATGFEEAAGLVGEALAQLNQARVDAITDRIAAIDLERQELSDL